MCEVKLHIPINSLPTEVSPQYTPHSHVGYCRIVQRDNRSITHITIFIKVKVVVQSGDDLMVVI